MSDIHAGVTISDALTLLATVLGPVLAVQAQKWVERNREKRGRKQRLFETLMSTRGDGLSFEHKKALNMIDLVFVGEKKVIDDWHSYLDSLNMQANDNNYQVIVNDRQGKFVSMLYSMSQSLGYTYDQVMIKRGYYSPAAHIDLDKENEKIRKGLVEVLSGKPLVMRALFDVDQSAVDVQADLQRKLASTITETGEMRVAISSAP